MKVAELRKIKSDKKIQTSNVGGNWFATCYSNGETLTPSISISGPTEEFVVLKVSDFLDKIGFSEEDSTDA